VAGAVFRRDAAGWAVSRCAPILRWMRGATPESIGAYLRQKGWPHEWR
jgi:hypothetical protein